MSEFTVSPNSTGQYKLTLTMLTPDMFYSDNGVDQDQLASKKAAGQDPP